MNKDTIRRTLSRRSALVAGLAASAVPLVAHAAPMTPTSTTPPIGPSPSLVAPPPRILSYRELGLPDDWSPSWENDEINGFGQMIWQVANEAWERTQAPHYHAEAAEAELTNARDPRQGFQDIDSTHTAELYAMAEHCTLMGWALAQTSHYAGNLELWCQQAMAFAGLTVLSPADRRAAKERTFSAYEAGDLLAGRELRARPANWAEAPAPPTS